MVLNPNMANVESGHSSCSTTVSLVNGSNKTNLDEDADEEEAMAEDWAGEVRPAAAAAEGESADVPGREPEPEGFFFSPG